MSANNVIILREQQGVVMQKELSLPLIQDADLKGKIVLIRVDHNVVKNGLIHDPYRIDATIGTMYHINARGGKIILMTHVGRPRDKKTGDINISEKTSVQPIVDYLQQKLHIKLKIPEFHADEKKGYPGLETSINHLIRELRSDGIDGIYLPNTRWFYGEEAKDENRERFANQLAGLADIFVNDAFGSWQAHASTVSVNKYLPSYAGFLLQKEIANLDRIYNPHHPFIAVVAGAKFDTKIDPLYALIRRADYLVLGGVIYNAYLSAKYGIKIKGVDDDDMESAKKFVDFAKQFPGKIVELRFIIESDIADGKEEGKYRTRDVRSLKEGVELNYIYDVASESFTEPDVADIFHKAETVFVNAVMGYTPYFNEGTIALDQLIDDTRGSVKLYGGGDTMQELKRLLPGLYIAAIDSPEYYIFTGGGAVLKAIEQGSVTGLAPVKALIDGKRE
jgi:phosphoglycerate kinase